MSPNRAKLSFREAKQRVVEAFERDFLLRALRRHGGNISKAAEEVGMYRQNLQLKMRELGITVRDAVKEPRGVKGLSTNCKTSTPRRGLTPRNERSLQNRPGFNHLEAHPFGLRARPAE
jgi:Bacterial regulatory protein, Fis family